jgi:hypothetical protein
MNHPRIISSSFNPVHVEPSRKRQTPPPLLTFQNVLKGGAQVLISGARVATQLVGGPVLSAAISRTGREASAALDGPHLTDTGGAMDDQQDLWKSFSEQRLTDDLKLLALQDRIQRDSRQVALISNVMKARHETAKSAIGNIRS